MTTLTSSDNAGVRVITMNRPDALNALSAEMMDDLADAFLAAATEVQAGHFQPVQI